MYPFMMGFLLGKYKKIFKNISGETCRIHMCTKIVQKFTFENFFLK